MILERSSTLGCNRLVRLWIDCGLGTGTVPTFQCARQPVLGPTWWCGVCANFVRVLVPSTANIEVHSLWVLFDRNCFRCFTWQSERKVDPLKTEARPSAGDGHVFKTKHTVIITNTAKTLEGDYCFLRAIQNYYYLWESLLSSSIMSRDRDPDRLRPGPIRSRNGWVLFVRGLPHETRECDLMDAFSDFGYVQSVQLHRNSNGTAKEYALIEFQEHSDAQDAINRMHGTQFLRHIIQVDWAFVAPVSDQHSISIGRGSPWWTHCDRLIDEGEKFTTRGKGWANKSAYRAFPRGWWETILQYK